MRRLRARVAPGSPPTVTVVVPCYNYGHFLPAAVASALDQERVAVDVVVVDDASPDGSGEVAAALAAADPRVRAVRHRTNTGHIATYNDGLALARGEFTVLLSADDLLAPGALARATGLMVRHPSVGLVYGIPSSFSTPRPPEPRPRRPSWSVWRGQEWLDWACRRGRNFIVSPEVVVRTRVLREVGPYNADLPHSGDLEYWLRVAARADVGRVNGPVHAHYRVHDANMHLTTFATMAVDLQERLAAFRTVLTLPGDAARNRTRFLRARRALAREAVGLAARSLVEGRPTAEAATLLGWACQTWPPAARGLRGRRVQASLDRAGAVPAARLLGHLHRQADRVRWHTWRAVGIS